MRAVLASALLLAGCAGEADRGEVRSGQDASGGPVSSTAIEISADAVPESSSVACTAEEEEIFSCRVKNGKRIAVCASEDRGGQYRFGKATPELVLDGGIWAFTPYSGGGEAQIAFTKGAIRYVVFSRMVRTNFKAGEPNDPVFSDGVIVLDGEKVIGLQACEDPEAMPIQYAAAEAYFPTADELFTWETGRADPNKPPE